MTALVVLAGFAGFYDSDNLTYAASIAYYALLSLFPFFLLALALLGRSTRTTSTIATAVLDVRPPLFPTRSSTSSPSSSDAFQRRRRCGIGVAGTIALVWGALGVFGAISTAVNYAWGVEKQRSFWKHKLFSFVMLLMAGLILLIALLLISASAGRRRDAGSPEVLRSFPGLDVLRSFTIRHATTLLFIVVVGLVYYFVPNAKVRFRDVWIGALVTGLLWKGALEAFSVDMRDMIALHARQRLDRGGGGVPGVGLPAGGDSAATASSSPPPTRVCGAAGREDVPSRA